MKKNVLLWSFLLIPLFLWGCAEGDVEMNDVGLEDAVDDERSVRGQIVVEGEGVTSEVDVWNCSGFEGEWNWYSKLDVHDFGSAEGSTTFVMPPRPEDDEEWRSGPINTEFEGTVASVEGYDVTINVVYEDNFAVLTDWTPESMLMTWDGSYTVTGSVSPIGVVYQETFDSSSQDVPLLVKYDDHPDC